MQVNHGPGGGRSASFLSLRAREASAEEEAEAQPATPHEHYRPSSRPWPWKRPLASLVGILLLGLWCTFTVQSRRLDRANLVLRRAARDRASASEGFNATEPAFFLSRASDCARTLSIPQASGLCGSQLDRRRAPRWAVVVVIIAAAGCRRRHSGLALLALPEWSVATLRCEHLPHGRWLCSSW